MPVHKGGRAAIETWLKTQPIGRQFTSTEVWQAIGFPIAICSVSNHLDELSIKKWCKRAGRQGHSVVWEKIGEGDATRKKNAYPVKV